MQIIRLSMITMLIFACAGTAQQSIEAGGNKKQTQTQSVTPATSVTPPVIFPNKEKFVIRESEPLVVAVLGACTAGDPAPKATTFELLPPTPSFIHISPVHQKETNDVVGTITSLAVLTIEPNPGDRGMYEVKIGAVSCGIEFLRVLSFRVKVKPAE